MIKYRKEFTEICEKLDCVVMADWYDEITHQRRRLIMKRILKKRAKNAGVGYPLSWKGYVRIMRALDDKLKQSDPA